MVRADGMDESVLAVPPPSIGSAAQTSTDRSDFSEPKRGNEASSVWFVRDRVWPSISYARGLLQVRRFIYPMMSWSWMYVI